MMGVDEQGRARAMPAEHLEEPAISGLAQTDSATAFRQAGPQHSQSPKPIHDLLRDHCLAIDGDRIDPLLAELPQLIDALRRLDIVGQIGIWQELAIQESAEEKSLGETDLRELIAQEFF